MEASAQLWEIVLLIQMKMKKIYVDATILYGHSMCQMLPYNEIEMWHGHSDL